MRRPARLLLAKRAVADAERLADFLRAANPVAAAETFELLLSALAMLRQHPLIGHAVEGGLRELVISRGRTGYVALYGYEELADRVVVYAIRHQREAGYSR